MLENFYGMKCKLIEQAKKMEEIFDGTHQYLNPRQVSRILCYIDRYRFEKNISLEHTFKSIFEKIQREPYAYDPTNLFGSSR